MIRKSVSRLFNSTILTFLSLQQQSLKDDKVVSAFFLNSVKITA
jgi:hypothetical protein